jgi:type I restriction enzyme, S subunit
MVNGELPSGWEWKKIEEIADTTSGGTPLRSHAEYYGGNIPWAKSGELRDGIIREVEETITEAGLKNSSAKLFPKDTVVVALYGATVGRTGILGIDATTNQAVCGIFPHNNSFTSRYMFYWLQSQRQNLINQSMGGAQPNISQGIIRSLSFPLAPITEQERIVAKIEELFTQLEAGKSALEHVQAGLRRYKASVLKAAVEGKLGADGIRPLLGRTPSARTGELPEGWQMTTVGEVSRKIQYGTSEKANLDSSGIPVLRMGNIQEGQLDFTNLKYLSRDAPGVKDLILDDGDLIFNRTNSAELVGKTAVYKSNHPKATFASYLIRVKFADTCLPDYVSFYINSLHGRKYIGSVVSQQVGQANVNGTKLANMPIPLPPLEEQRRIVAEVERRLSVARAVETTVEDALVRASRLRQAVLRSAFEGRL